MKSQHTYLQVSNEPDIARSSDKENEMHVTATKEERVKHSDPVEKAEHLDEEKPGWTNNCNDEALKRIIERVSINHMMEKK